MPDKIEIPPERPCPVCGATGKITKVVDTIKAGPDVPADIVGAPILDFETCTYCGGTGRARVFDELAAAVRAFLPEAEIATQEVFSTPDEKVSCRIKNREGAPGKKLLVFGEGPNDTAALVAAAENANQGG